MRLAALIGTGLLLAGPAVAQQPMAEMDHQTKACPATPVPLPGELAGWNRMTPAKAGATAAKAADLSLGEGVGATLLPTPKVSYPLRPEKPGGSVSYGGLFGFTVAETGHYRVALGSGAWIDVVKDGAALTSIAHGHGPDCSTVRKMVDFGLSPGRYVLQVVGNGSPTLPLLVARLP